MATRTAGLLPVGWLSVGKSFLAVLQWGANLLITYLPTHVPETHTVLGFRGPVMLELPHMPVT
jgi:hypothetical protein